MSISECELLQVRFRFFFVDTCINICICQPQLTWLRTHTHTYIEDEALEHKVKTDQFIDDNIVITEAMADTVCYMAVIACLYVECRRQLVNCRHCSSGNGQN